MSALASARGVLQPNPFAAMRQWPAKRWLAAIATAAVLAILIGIPTGVVANPLYHRMTPTTWWDYPVWALSAVLVGLTGLRLDGVVLARPDLQVETHAGRAPLPRRLDLPLGRSLRVHVVTGQALGAGSHSLEADITVPGVASGRLVVEGTVLSTRAAPQPS